MKCAVCDQTARVLAERDQPGQPKARRYLCGEPKCDPKEPGWTKFPLEAERARG